MLTNNMLIKKSVAHWSSKFSFGDVIYMQGFLMCLKHPDVADLSMTNISNFSPVALAAAIPMSLTLLFFLPPEHFSPNKWLVLSGRHW